MSKDLQLSNRITQIISYYFQNPNSRYKDLADKFNVSLPRISQIMNHPRVINAYPILAKRRIKSLVPKAVHKLENLMEQNVNLGVSEKVVSRILDSEKVLEPQERKVIHELQMKSTEELQQIIDNASKLPKQVIEAEIIEEATEGQE